MVIAHWFVPTVANFDLQEGSTCVMFATRRKKKNLRKGPKVCNIVHILKAYVSPKKFYLLLSFIRKHGGTFLYECVKLLLLLF